MDELKYFVKVCLTLIEKTGPTLATIAAVYLAYRYTKKQKWNEDKAEEHKKVRKAISNLVQIWRELSYIEYYAKSDGFFAELVFKDPKLASNYFGIDVRRIKRFKHLFHESKEELKSINVSLFYDLENNFMEFNKTFNHFNSSSKFKQNEQDDLKELIDDLLVQLVRDLENIISNTASHLPLAEKNEIVKIIEKHHNDLTKTDFDSEVPEFLINLLNSIAPLKEEITSEDVQIFVTDHTVKMLINKAMPLIFRFIMKENPLQSIQQMISVVKNPDSIETDIKIDPNELLLNLNITEEENNMLKNNKQFYRLLCGLVFKIEQKVPIDIMRLLLSINNGTVDLKKELEAQKAQLIIDNNNLNNSEE